MQFGNNRVTIRRQSEEVAVESLVVEMDDETYADRFRAAAEHTTGAPSSIVQRSAHVTVLELRAPELTPTPSTSPPPRPARR